MLSVIKISDIRQNSHSQSQRGEVISFAPSQ
jgi:hypothetical protein